MGDNATSDNAAQTNLPEQAGAGAAVDVDWSSLPDGERGWRAFLATLRLDDDRDERYFIEFKSDVDLNTAHGQAKVAKFVLGAANRDPVTAAARFGGHAVMLLGVGQNGITGIGGFEANHLDTFVRRFTGSDGPRWDYTRVPVGDGRDVVALWVHPPTGQPFPCHSALTLKGTDGKDRLVLRDGALYVRGDGETREATGAEVVAIYRRQPSPAPDVDITVAVSSGLTAFDINHDARDDFVTFHRDRLTSIYDKYADSRSKNSATSATRSVLHYAGQAIRPDRRGVDGYHREIDTWAQTVERAWPQFAKDVAAGTAPALAIDVTNNAKTFLTSVEVTLIVRAPARVVARERANPSDSDALREALPALPKPWTPESELPTTVDFPSVGLPRLDYPDFPRFLTVTERAHETVIAYRIDDIRPLEEFVLGDDVVVLLSPSDFPDGVPTTVDATWTVTARDIHDVFTGDITIDIDHSTDWTHVIRDLLDGVNESVAAD